MINAEKEQVKELCDRAILTFMSTDKVIETLENNEWAEFTLAEGQNRWVICNLQDKHTNRRKIDYIVF